MNSILKTILVFALLGFASCGKDNTTQLTYDEHLSNDINRLGHLQDEPEIKHNFWFENGSWAHPDGIVETIYQMGMRTFDGGRDERIDFYKESLSKLNEYISLLKGILRLHPYDIRRIEFYERLKVSKREQGLLVRRIEDLEIAHSRCAGYNEAGE